MVLMVMKLLTKIIQVFGEWHTLDDVEHAMGADKNTCSVSVFDENDELVWVTNKPVISNTDYVVSVV